MTLTILDDTVISDQSAHTARTVSGKEHAWMMSRVPGRCPDPNSAITTMVLADVTGRGGMNQGHRLRAHVEGWAAGLGLTAPGALPMPARTAARTDPGKDAMPSDPGAAG